VTRHVLVVDDDPMVCRAISRMLARGGYSVAIAHDLAPALAAADAHRPEILVCDLNMPTPGPEVVREIKGRFAGVFAVLVSGDDLEAVRDQWSAAGVDAVLSKPLVSTELWRVLAAAP
jgi:CheY-like chemotaxis protein